MTDTERPAEAAEPVPPAEPDQPAAPGVAAPDSTSPQPARSPRASQGETPLYKGEPLDSERGPGLGCFWMQAILLGILLVVTPITVALGWPPVVSAVLLIVTLILLLFTGQTVIFLLRLVAADKRGRRTPRSATARKTVGMLEDESAAPQPPSAPDASDATNSTDTTGEPEAPGAPTEADTKA